MSAVDEAWIEWLSTRPPEIQAVAKTHPPGIYKLRLSDGELSPNEYVLVGYTEADTPGESPTAILHTEGLLGVFPRQVYGVAFTDLIAVKIFNPGEEK